MIYSMGDKANPSRLTQASPPVRATAGETAAGLDDVGALRTFARVVEQQSFSKAARQMGVTPSAVSKQISALEAQLRTRLVNRTTRQLVITDAGERLYRRFLRVAEELREAQEELSSMHAEPTGHLRVSLPLALGIRCIAPHIPDFLKRYRALSLDLDLSVAKVDLLTDHFDVAVRIADKLGDGLVAIRLAPYQRVFCAAGSYLAERGTPQRPEELSGHECLVGIGARPERSWPVAEGHRIRHIAVSGRFVVNHAEALYEATVAGLGIAMHPRWRVAEALRTGLLTEILPQFAVQQRSIWAVLAQRGAMSPKVRVFVEFLRATLADLDEPSPDARTG